MNRKQKRRLEEIENEISIIVEHHNEKRDSIQERLEKELDAEWTDYEKKIVKLADEKTAITESLE